MIMDQLDKWEERLRPQVMEVDLLGEVPLSEDEVRLLGQLIGDLVRRKGWTQAARLLREQYPCSYAVFMVAQGARGYEAGDFWSAIREATGLSIPPTQALQWGQLFEEIVQKLPVVQFPPLGGPRYIGPILAHGGIPDYCLADFFDHFLRPLVTRPEYASLSVEEFIQRRLLQASVTFLTDKPVLRFLQYGGQPAVDFVERCREMALAWEERGEIPSPEALGLPPRVVKGYQDWLEGRARPSLRRRAIYRSPVLFLDPWGWGPALRLPSQPVPGAGADMKALWLIFLDSPTKIGVDVRKDEPDWKTVPCDFPLPGPAPEYRVALAFARVEEDERFPQEVQREWWIPGLREESPLLWFDPKDGRQLLPQDTLPAGRLWVLRPPDVVLETDPPESLQVTEEFPRMPGEWCDYIGEEVDLSQARRLTVRRGNQPVREYTVLGLGPEDQPALVGGRRLPIDDDRPPFYVGVPPSLRIPLPPTPRLHRWYVEIRNEGPALPPVQVSFTLADLQQDVDVEDGVAVLDLREWLGEEPMGTYQVKVRGPLGHKANLAFRILPVLGIAGHDTLYLPEAMEEARLLVETDTQTTLTLQPGTNHCRVDLMVEENGRRLYEVTAGVARADFPLRFVRPTDRGDAVYVPLSVPIRRLRWMLVLGREHAGIPEWRTTSLRLPLDALEQAREPLLLVDLFGGTVGNLTVRLSLQDEDGTVLQEREGRWRAGQPHLRFDLAAFLDTLRQSAGLSFVFHLVMQGLPGRGEVSYPTLQVARRFVAQWKEIESAQIMDTIYLRLRWEASFRVRHRLVRLWPVWRPWEPPMEIPIPDKAQDEYVCAFPAAQLVPGRYLVEFSVQDPWTAASPNRPSPTSPTVRSVLIPRDAVMKRLHELRHRAARDGLSFLLALEAACIRRDAGQEGLARKAFQWCFEHLDEAEIAHILALVREVVGDPDLEGPLRVKMAAASRIQRMLDTFHRGELPKSLYREYLAGLPSPSLWPTETCKLLMEVDDEQTRFQAGKQLIMRKDPSGAQVIAQWLQECGGDMTSLIRRFTGAGDKQLRFYIMKWSIETDLVSGVQTIVRCLKEGLLSHEEATSLIQEHLPQSLEALVNILPDPAAQSLLEQLRRRDPERVPVIAYPGCWIRCVAGWGRLERIEGADGLPRQVVVFSDPEPGLHFYVLLRAHDPQRSEKALINLDENTVVFPDAQRVYMCSKCRMFCSADYNLIIEHHDRVAHGGIHPSFQTVSARSIQQLVPLTFSRSIPPQPWE